MCVRHAAAAVISDASNGGERPLLLLLLLLLLMLLAVDLALLPQHSMLAYAAAPTTISLSASIRAGILVVSGVTTISVDISLALLEVLRNDRQGVLLFFCYVCVAKILRYTNCQLVAIAEWFEPLRGEGLPPPPPRGGRAWPGATATPQGVMPLRQYIYGGTVAVRPS